MDKFRRKFASVVARPIVLHPGDAEFSGDVLKLPLYMAMLIPEMEPVGPCKTIVKRPFER